MSTINIGSSLPAGSSTLGNIKLVDTAGTNQVAIDANNNLHVALYSAANSMAIDSSNNAHVGVWSGANQLVVNANGTIPVVALTATLFTTAQSTVGSSNSGDLSVGAYREVSIDITTTAQAGTSPTLQFFWERKGADGNYYAIWQSVVLTAAANTLSTSIGHGMAYNHSLALTGRLRWVVGGTATPTWTFTPNVYAK